MPAQLRVASYTLTDPDIPNSFYGHIYKVAYAQQGKEFYATNGAEAEYFGTIEAAQVFLLIAAGVQ